MVQIINNADTLTVIDGDHKGSYPKNQLSVRLDGPFVKLYYQGRLALTTTGDNVTVPVAASNDELLSIIQGYLNDSGFDGKKLVVGTSREKFRDEFFDFDTDNNWTVVQQGAGMSITVDGTSGGSRYLNINSGVVVNEETIVQSRGVFQPSVRIVAGITMNQRIANTECYFELVEVDDSGHVVVDATFPSPFSRNVRNSMGFLFDGTSPTNGRYYVRAQGISEFVAAATSFGTNHSVASGTAPNFMPAYQYELIAFTEMAAWVARTVNSTSAGTTFYRTDMVPNPIRKYAVRIRVKNLGTAPVSGTDFRIHFLRILDATRMSVDFGVIGGVSNAQLAAPVTVVTMPTVSASVSMASAAPTVYNDTISNLNAGATFTGTARDAGATNTRRKFCAIYMADQPYTARIEMSNDGTTWRKAAEVTGVAAHTPTQLEVNVCTRYHRVVMTNTGGAATTQLMVNSSYHFN